MNRPGIRTSEFWLTLAAVVAGGLTTAFADAEWAKVAGLIGMALASMGYSGSRADVKEAEAKVDEE